MSEDSGLSSAFAGASLNDDDKSETPPEAQKRNTGRVHYRDLRPPGASVVTNFKNIVAGKSEYNGDTSTVGDNIVKYKTAQNLHKEIGEIRKKYKEDWKSESKKQQQHAVALYIIDRWGLRIGKKNEKYTVGCCLLLWKHVELLDNKNNSENTEIKLDFLGKSSVPYSRQDKVDSRVYNNLQSFMKEKKSVEDRVFDKINAKSLNEYIKSLVEGMKGLTAKDFRTYNASEQMQRQLCELSYGSPSQLVNLCNSVFKNVALFLNHQSSIPEDKIEKTKKDLNQQIDNKKTAIRNVEDPMATQSITVQNQKISDKRMRHFQMELNVLEVEKKMYEIGKCVGVDGAKMDYIDPRIIVAWCKEYGVPIDRIYTKKQKARFAWAIEDCKQTKLANLYPALEPALDPAATTTITK